MTSFGQCGEKNLLGRVTDIHTAKINNWQMDRKKMICANGTSGDTNRRTQTSAVKTAAAAISNTAP
jgi:hypothetical protein